MSLNNFLITGCAGFIGSHAADLFYENGHNVVGVDKLTYAGNHAPKKIINYEMDICDKVIESVCQEFNVNCIINFAAESHVDNSIKGYDSFIKSNIQGVKNLLEICKKLDIPLIHISTDEVYGPIREGSFHENAKMNPQNYYSATKAAAEHLVSAYHNTHNVQYMMVRMSNNYGPRQHEEKFLPTILKSLSTGKKIPLYGKGDNVRDWIYVKDSVRAIYNLVMKAPPNEVYNISFKDEKTNTEVINEVLNTLDLNWNDCVEHVTDRLGHDFRYSITNDKMMNFIDFDATPFHVGLKQTIDWFKE